MDGTVVAVKEIQKGMLLDANRHRQGKILERLEFEVEALRECSQCEGVCAMKDVVETEGIIYIVMELCEGQQLFDVVKGSLGGFLAEPLAAFIFGQIVRTCQCIHDVGFIHRDLKPENILCCGSGRDMSTKVVDFGAAKRLHNELTASVSGTTVWNASPERSYGEVESSSTDVWALGCMLYFMLVGNAPFHNLYEGDVDDAVVIDRVLEDELSWPESPQVSREARRLVEWMLKKEANERPQVEDIVLSQWLKKKEAEYHNVVIE